MTAGTTATAPNKKPWHRSWTLWVNLLAAVLVALESGLDVLRQIVPGDFYLYVALVLPLVNAALRVVTSQGLHLPQTVDAWVSRLSGRSEDAP
ncbi:DUF7940 domain-containing protein [Lysobacter sp. CA196]|uniref:DUF7940 domain-containing protein n=1 Tax=Lysobacter sp. CA196 TaxID=3455606 RepID=UPI003F8D2CE5